MIWIIVQAVAFVAIFAGGFGAGFMFCRAWTARMMEKIGQDLMPTVSPMPRPLTGKLSDPANSPFIPPTARHQPPKTPTADALRKMLQQRQPPAAKAPSKIEPPSIDWGKGK
jgi:hypothetical protein